MSISASVVAFGDVMQALAKTAADMVIAARDDALEEAAKVGEKHGQSCINSEYLQGWDDAARTIAGEIRKLKRAP